MRFGLYDKNTILSALCLVFMGVCAMYQMHVQAAEDGGVLQPASAKIYSGMSDDAGTVANLIIGNVFEVIEAESDESGGIWYKIRTDFGAEGYVKAGELDQLIAAAQITQSAPEVENTSDAAPSNVENPSEPSENTPSNVENPSEPSENTPSNVENPQENMPALDTTTENEAGLSAVDAAEVPKPASENPLDQDIQQDNAVSQEYQQNSTASQGMLRADISDNASDTGLLSDNKPDLSPDGAGADNGIDSTEDMMQSAAGFGNVSDIGHVVSTQMDVPKKRRHGGIDIVLIMITAGGIICIAAIAALVKRMLTYLRMQK